MAGLLNPSSYGNQIQGANVGFLPNLFTGGTANKSNAVQGTANQSVLPAGKANISLFPGVTQPMGTKAKSPASNVQSPSTTLPKNQQQPSGTLTEGQQAAIKGVQSAFGGGTQNQQQFTPQTSYGQYTASLANTPGTFQKPVGYLAGLLSGAYANNPQVQEAKQYIQDLTNQYAQQANIIGNQPGLSQQGLTGREGLLQNQYIAEYGGAQTALQNALQSLGYQQAGYQQAGALTTQEQGLTQQAVGQAAGLAAPQYPSYTNAVYNPLTNQFETVGGGAYGTGPAAAANISSIQNQTQQVNDWSAARQSAQSLSDQLNSLIQQNGINPSDLNAVNKFIQGIMGQTSSSQYQTFSNIVNDLASVYSQILTPAGGNTTDMVRTISQSLLNASASGQSIMQVIQNLDQQAQNRISGVQRNIQNLQSGQNVNPLSLNNQASGDSIYNF